MSRRQARSAPAMPAMPATVDAVTRLVLCVFRAHGALLTFGDELVAPLGLSSARWQVLGAVALAGHPLTVPAIARGMGLSRQAVQKQVDRMLNQGLVELVANQAHRRSPLIALTALGRRRYRAAMRRWLPAANALGKPHALGALEQTSQVLDAITQVLTPRVTRKESP